MRKILLLTSMLMFLAVFNFKVDAQETSDTTSATLEETLSWIKNKVDQKKYKLSYEYVSCEDKISKTISTTSINCLTLFTYDTNKLTFTVTSIFTTIWYNHDSIAQPASFTIYLSDINTTNLVCYKDTVYKETRDYENTDQKGNEKQSCEITTTMYRYCSMFFNASGKRYEMIIPDEFIYDRLLKAFNHAIKLAQKTEKF